MTDLPIAAVVRIAKNHGAERVGADAAEVIVAKAEEYVAKLTTEAVRFAQHAGRKTIKAEDITMIVENMK